MTKTPTKVVDDRSYPPRPVVGIGIIIWREDKIVLIKRGHEPAKGKWRLPGGAQHVGETIMQAAVREAREETGLDIMALGVITAIDSISHDHEGKVKYHYTMIDVLAEALEGDAKAGDDAVDVRWVAMDEIDTICDWPEVARVVRLSALQRAL
jgi:ADP-ribose pyrophosphatase YjhB (NUDIX family)